MPLILGCLALFFPRLVIALLFIFTNYLGRAFHSEWWWPLLGFFFLPFTTLAYAFAMNQGGGVHGLYLVLIIVGVLLDLGVLGGNAKVHRQRRVIVRRES